MFTEKEFRDRYANAPLGELLAVLEAPAKYQPLAVKAAKEELDSRDATEEEKQEALRQWRKKQEAPPVVLQEQAETAIKAAKATLGAIRPDTAEPVSVSRTIRIILVIYLLIFLQELYQLLFGRVFSLAELAGGSLVGAVFFFIFILQPFALAFFYLRKKAGWLLLFFLAISHATEVIHHYVFFLGLDSVVKNILSQGDWVPNEVMMGFRLLLFGGTAYRIAKPDIRELYHIRKGQVLLFSWIFFGLALFLLALISY